MKNTSILLVTVLILSIGVSSIKSLGFKDVIILEYDFSTPVISERGNGEYTVRIGTLPITNNVGEPRLPVKPVRILLPIGRTVSTISVTYNDKILVGVNLSIERGHPVHILSNQGESISSKTSSHREDDLYSMVGVYKWRGYPILVVTLHPVTYNLDTGELFYYPHLTLKVYTTKETFISYPIRGLERDKRILETMVDNPEYIDTYDDIETSCKDALRYIVITSEALANSGLEDNFQYLVYSRIEKGIPSAIYTVEEIMSDQDYSVNGTWGDNNPSNPFYEHPIRNYDLFNDKAARIRNFIRYAYLELGVDYVLLGGDADIYDEEENIIPARGLFANESGLPLSNLDEEEADIPSDIYYACLDGSFNYDEDEHFGESADRNNIIYRDEADLYAEVWVGRACVDSDIEVANFVSKTLRYEGTHDPYLKKVLLVGEYLGFPGVSEYGGNYKDLIIPLIPDNYNVETLYDRDSLWDKYDIIEIINNATPHIINHDGHSYYGYNLKMTNGDVDQLVNENLFFLYSHGCMAGGFDNPYGYDCIAERYTVETPFGAFAAIMNSRYGLGSEDTLDSPSMALDESFFKALFKENIREIGRANHYSKEDHIWHIDENGIRWVYYETNLFGDPIVAIKNPTPIHVNLSISFTHPEKGGLYLLDKRILTIPLINLSILLGGFTVEVNASSQPAGYLYSVELLVDDEPLGSITTPPYKWVIREKLLGFHKLVAVARGYYGERTNTTLLVYTFIP